MMWTATITRREAAGELIGGVGANPTFALAHLNGAECGLRKRVVPGGIVAENSVAYHRRREAVERELAKKAVDPEIARIHRDLADRYAELILEAEAKPSARSKLHLRT